MWIVGEYYLCSKKKVTDVQLEIGVLDTVSHPFGVFMQVIELNEFRMGFLSKHLTVFKLHAHINASCE